MKSDEMTLWLDLKFLLDFWAKIWNFNNLGLLIKGCINICQVCTHLASEQAPLSLIILWFSKSL